MSTVAEIQAGEMPPLTLRIGWMRILRILLLVVIRAHKWYRLLPYHNYGHAQSVGLRAAIMSFRQNRNWVQAFAQFVAGVVHDMGGHQDPTTFTVNWPWENGPRPARNREEASSWLGWRLLLEIEPNPSEELMKWFKFIVLLVDATNVADKMELQGEYQIRAIDLQGLGWRYERFLEDWNRLRLEGMWQPVSPFVFLLTKLRLTALLVRRLEKQGKVKSAMEFAKGCVPFLAMFMAVRIELTAAFYNRRRQSDYHVRVIRNILRVVAETWQQECRPIKVVGQAMSQRGELAFAKDSFPEGTLGIVFADDAQGELAQLQQAYKPKGGGLPLLLVIPAVSQVLSAPDAALDELHLDDKTVREYQNGLRAVMKQGGRLLIHGTNQPLRLEGFAITTRTSGHTEYSAI